MSDVDVIDDLVFALLEGAARKLCVPSWPQASPPPKSPDVPLIEARRDDDGVLGVFRFATVVADDAIPRPHFEVRLGDAQAEGAAVGDDVGVELPLHVLCAIALADIDASALPADVADDLAASGLQAAVTARLSLLRGPPPSSPELSELRALVTRHGAGLPGGHPDTPGVVRWTMSVQGHHDRAGDDVDDPARPDRLVCCVERGGMARLVVVDAERGQASRRRLLQAIGPVPADDSLWRALEREGPRLVTGGDGLQAEEQGAVVVVAVVAVDTVVVDADALDAVVVHGRRSRRLMPGAPGDAPDVLDEQVFGARLAIDAAALFIVVDAAAAERVTAAAAVFHKRLAARLHDAAVASPSAGDDVLTGAAVLRVLSRAARGTALAARGNTELGVEDCDDGSFVVDVHGRSLRLVPADDAVFVDVNGSFCLAARRGQLIDGDVEAFRGTCAAIADAVAGSDADADLVFVDDAGAEREQTLAQWLTSLGEADVTGWLPPDAAAARAWQDVVDVLLDER